ncbi:hypothetical protein SAMN04489712_12142 [Thermomonospora echinospora]|uniref:Uncharacterized protein n=1 Tax=Thermomonospora echinospora TaxID=1992 RepID=A0A1H6DSA2_9ACTN|nr:hypothetical protein [Thermomonospora echinospora]SEG87944.1 hypothetical protein SAMN04489712_12142 [Thermomonospora echinospora]
MTIPPNPSITTWTRLEPRTRVNDFGESVAARVEDPAWLLGRQWQLGEFAASSGGSPATVRMRVTAGRLSAYRGTGGSGATATGYDPMGLPLETLVEREPDHGDLGLRADGGRLFLRLLTQHGIGRFRKAFTAAYPLPVPDSGDPAIDAAVTADLGVLAGRVPDAAALATAFASGVVIPPLSAEEPPPTGGERRAAEAAAAEFRTAWASYVSRPGAEVTPWDSTRLEHAFALGARLGTDDVTLVAREYLGGALDWYDLDVAADGTQVPATQPSTDIVSTGIPTPIRYPGMPADRWWEFEDGRVHFGGIETGATDLGHMLLAEFATLYSNDWFTLPVELPVGTIARVSSLVVTDTFGIRTVIEAAAHPDWEMFRLRGGGPDTALFVLPPVAAHTMDGEPVEDVLLVRDEAANIVWGVEKLVEHQAGRPLDRHELHLAALRAAPPPPVPPPSQGDLDYRLRAAAPPEHWIPYVPQATADRLRLVRSALTRPVTGQPIPPLSRLLTAAGWLADEEVPREGARVMRQWRLARWTDGSTHLWQARRKRAGRGEASSGLRYDVLTRREGPPAG